MKARTSDVTTCARSVLPSDGAAASWRIPDEVNGFGTVALRLFNFIPPFDDYMFLLLLLLFTESLGNGSVHSFHRRQRRVDTAAEAAHGDLTPLCSLSAAPPPPVGRGVTFDPTKMYKKGVIFFWNMSQLPGETSSCLMEGDMER